MSEMNPEHPVTIAVRDRWQQLLALAVSKYCKMTGKPELIITDKDVDRLNGMFHPETPALVMDERPDGIHLRLIQNSAARAAHAIEKARAIIVTGGDDAG